MEVLGQVMWGLACLLSLWGLFTFFGEIFRPARFPRGPKGCYPLDLRRLISGLYALGMIAAVGAKWIGWIYLRYWYNAYYKVLDCLREACALLWDAYECNLHLKKPPTIGDLLSVVCGMYENKKALISTETGELLWHACESLQKANRLYEENIKDVPRRAKIDESIYADKDLSSQAGEKMLPHLNEAEDYFNSVDILLGVHRAHVPDLWN